MNNRLGLGLAVGAGYLLGRTKKAKLAFGIGTLVMGKRLQLSPRAIADFAAAQLAGNPQFKEIGDQLRGDLRGVGKAATGALLNRQIEGLADRLHDRTLGVQDRISGVVPDVTGSARDEEPEEPEEYEEDDERPAKSSSKSSSRSSSRSSSGSDSGSGSGRESGTGSAKSSGRRSSRSSSRASDSDGGSTSKPRSTTRSAAKSASSRASSATKATKSVQRTAKRAPAKKTASRRAAQGGEDRG
ncbi:DNA primase [Streptomyces xanthochromogenes]|uniref:DNA primase n=1 Tax=Streptomyces TaxID=1883 RepID=UPI00136F2088|nr:DNA primase [Streptomyces sp. SID1034]MYV88884.1 DNA primase [Streptomyces sp. SID1034]